MSFSKLAYAVALRGGKRLAEPGEKKAPDESYGPVINKVGARETLSVAAS